jgi:diguanylate cyclase (GGDEF)-like protein/PAS domain S-box-containing protein
LFGFVHGVYPWVSLFGINFLQQTSVDYAASFVLTLSMIALLEFWRRLVSYSYFPTYASMAIVFALLAWQNFAPIEMMLYQLITAASIILGFMAFWKRSAESSESHFKIIGIMIWLYAVANMTVVLKSDMLFIHAFNPDGSIFLFQAVGAFLDLLIFGLLWIYYLRFEVNSEKPLSVPLRKAVLPLFVLGIILSSGWLFVDRLGEHRKELLTEDLLTRITLAAKSTDREKITHLTASESDIGNPDYEELKKFLMTIKIKSRFLYLMTLREGEVYFMVDSEPTDSPDYSPAGQIFTEIEPEFVQKLHQNKPFVYGPYTDRWGTWNTAVIPLELTLHGKFPIYFCGDADAAGWVREINNERFSGITIVFLFSVLVVYFFLMTTKILQINVRLKEEVGLFVGGPAFVMKWRLLGGDFKVLYVSPNMTLHLGYDPDMFLSNRISFIELIHPEDRTKLVHALDAIGQQIDTQTELEFRLLHLNGSYRWLQAFILSKNHQYPLSYHGYFTDITDKKDAESALKTITDRLVSHFHQVPFAVIEWDTDFRVVDWNPAAERIFGYTKEEAQGQRAEDIILPSTVIEQTSKIWSDLLGANGGNRSTNENQTKEGKIILCEWYNSPLFDENNQVIGIASVAEDVTEKKQFEQKLQYLAYYDELTGLPNRALFKDRMETESRRADRNHAMVGVVFIDVDFFKTVNDTLGHGIGDILLQAVASRLKTSFRRSDTVSRFGGDEFSVLIPDLHQEEEIEDILQNVYDHFRAPFEILEHTLYVTLSIGYNFYPLDAANAEMLFRNADAAMYAAKESGRNKYRRYLPEMTDYIQSQLSVQNGLINALKNNEFVLYYQPQMDIASGRITGVEALIRWNHPERGMLSPAEFIPIAEKTGLIVPIGEWVLRSACQQLKSWNTQGIQPLIMAVNLSSRQFKEEKFFNKTIDIFHETGVDPNAIELELTESILLEDTAKVLKILTDFKREGVNLSLDDFGTGYSSLSYLKLFPINKLKIDQSFIKNITAYGSDSNLVKAIIAMGRALNLTTIAEGVELQEQFDFLRQEGCDEIQGYLLGKPMPAGQFEIFLSDWMGREKSEHTLNRDQSGSNLRPL